jgi:V8-like Glu-specific endopeptidase
VGRLYVKTLDGMIRHCSAAAVAPSVVLTAAHCVMDGTRSQFNEWFAFVPGQEGSSLPYGVWWAKSALVSQYYGGDGSATHDYAFLVMYPSRGAEGGLELGNVVGWAPLLIYSTVPQAVHVGYPATGPFATFCSAGSCYAWYCYSSIADYYAGDTGAVVGLPCHTGFGSSGGPWFEPYAGGWYVASDVSSGSGGDVFSEIWGPYFGADTLYLYWLALWASAS